jgi:glutamate-1-semialdehyde 2,1-aminomutase
VGPIYQAGTLSGNPLAVTAGIAMLLYLDSHRDIYETIARRTEQLTESLPPGVAVNRTGSMFTLFMQPGPVTDFESAKKSDTARYGRLFHFLLDHGVYFPPSQFEAGFMSAAHSEKQVLATNSLIRDFLQRDQQ